MTERDEDGLYVASVPLLQGCYSQGETYEEALLNVKDAIKLHIEARRSLGEPVSGCHEGLNTDCQRSDPICWGAM